MHTSFKQFAKPLVHIRVIALTDDQNAEPLTVSGENYAVFADIGAVPGRISMKRFDIMLEWILRNQKYFPHDLSFVFGGKLSQKLFNACLEIYL
ncbi:MAG: hypothetical protein AAB798_01955 [Patescibacteria group bacterium]